MIKVIKYGQKRRVECKECGSFLEYEKEDVKGVRTGMNEYEYQIKCPVCRETIVVPCINFYST